jgi:hypothetical protein
MAVADGSVSEYDIQSAGRHIEKAAGECLDIPLQVLSVERQTMIKNGLWVGKELLWHLTSRSDPCRRDPKKLLSQSRRSLIFQRVILWPHFYSRF